MIKKWAAEADVMETALDAACMIQGAALRNRRLISDRDISL